MRGNSAESPTWVAGVLARFDGLSGGPKRWDACCPAHEDKKASLSITIGNNGGLLVRCMSPHQCPLAEILTAAGLTYQELFPPDQRKYKRERTMSAQKRDWKFVESYDYRDAEGVLRYQVLRWAPKAFTQRRPNPNFDQSQKEDKEKNPRMLGNMEGVQRLLYKLPELRAALAKQPDRMVWIMEGEKDVNLATKCGLLATCNSGGSLKWEDSFGKELKGCNVIVVADNDPVDSTVNFSPGLRHAAEVCENLRANGVKSVRLIVCPDAKPKGDFSAYFAENAANGMTEADIIGKLKAHALKAPEWHKPGAEPPKEQATAAPPPTSEPTPPPPSAAPVVPPPPPPADGTNWPPPAGTNVMSGQGEPKPSGNAAPTVPAGKRGAITLDDFLKAVHGKMAEFGSNFPTGPASSAELIGSLQITLHQLTAELARLPGAVDVMAVRAGLVNMAALCGEYLIHPGKD